jgi:hypothetical protein
MGKVGFQLIPGIQIASFPLWCLSLEKEIPGQLPEGYAVENWSHQIQESIICG